MFDNNNKHAYQYVLPPVLCSQALICWTPDDLINIMARFNVVTTIEVGSGYLKPLSSIPAVQGAVAYTGLLEDAVSLSQGQRLVITLVFAYELVHVARAVLVFIGYTTLEI